MLNNKKAESLLGIVIGIFILSIVILGIANLLINSKINMGEIENDLNETLLKQNSINIGNLVSLEGINNNEIFYIKKGPSNFEVFTGSTNEKYKYIDIYGENIENITIFEGKIYSREYKVNYNTNIYNGKNIKNISLEIKKIK